MSGTAKKILAIGLLLLFFAVAAFAWLHFSPSEQVGDKRLYVSVIHGDGSVKELEIQTDAENLRDALEQEKLVSGEESQYGLFITTVDGESADEAAQQWWCITRGGETVTTGADDTLITDGEHYELELKTGYDF